MAAWYILIAHETSMATRRGNAGRLRQRYGAIQLSRAEVKDRQKRSSLLLEIVELETDEMGWPRAFWELAGSAPDFDLGDRRKCQDWSA